MSYAQITREFLLFLTYKLITNWKLQTRTKFPKAVHTQRYQYKYGTIIDLHLAMTHGNLIFAFVETCSLMCRRILAHILRLGALCISWKPDCVFVNPEIWFSESNIVTEWKSMMALPVPNYQERHRKVKIGDVIMAECGNKSDRLDTGHTH